MISQILTFEESQQTMNRLILSFLVISLPLLLKAQSTFYSAFMLGASLTNVVNLQAGFSDHYVKNEHYQYYFEQTNANYLVDYDSVNQREIWVFPKSQYSAATYFVVGKTKEVVFLCSTEIKDACRCRWDMYYYNIAENKMVWLKSKNLFSVKSELEKMLKNEAKFNSSRIEAMNFCELVSVMGE